MRSYLIILKSRFLKEFVSPIAGVILEPKLFLLSIYSNDILDIMVLILWISFFKVVICYDVSCDNQNNNPPFLGHKGSLDVKYRASFPLKILLVTLL